MGLLLADLQGVANGLRQRAGHGSLVARVAPPLVLGAMYWLLGSMLLEHREIVQALHRHGDAQSILMAAALSPCPVVAGWVGFAHVHRQLFEAPELALWLCAPAWPGRAAVQVLLRAAGAALLWALALAAPFALQLLRAAGAPAGAYPLLPLAIAAAVLPTLGATLVLQLVLMRLAAGRAARTLLGILSAFASFGFPVFLLTQVFSGAPARAVQLAQSHAVDQGASPLVTTATELLVSAARGAADPAALQRSLLLLLATAAAFALAAPLHPVAAQNYGLAYRPRRLRGGHWPAAPAAAIRTKEIVQTLQQPGALWQMLIVAAMTCLLAQQQLVVREMLGDVALPAPIRHCAAMAALWCLSVTMLLYAHMGRLAVWDGPQWPLYMQAPIAPATLLRGKLQTIALLLLWPIAATVFAGVQWFEAGPGTVLAFIGFASAGTLAALAAIASIGTLPWLLRRELDGRLGQGARGLVGSIALMLTFQFAIAPGFVAFELLDQAAHRGHRPDAAALLPAALAAAFGIGLLEFGLAAWSALANYRRLLAPR